MKRFVFATFLVCGCLSAAPKITAKGARNAASYASPSTPGGTVAQGSRFVLVGKELGPAEAVSNEAYPLSTELGGVSVKVTVGDSTVDALVLVASATKVEALLPSTVATGKGTVTLSFNGETVETAIEVSARSLGFFANGMHGSGQVIAISDTTPVTLAASARPGQTIRLRATGLGPVQADEASAPTPQTFEASEIEVRVGDKTATVTAAARTEVPGIDEISIEVPAGVEGCFVPVAAKLADKWTNFVSLPIAANSATCSTTRLSSSDLDRILANSEGGIIRWGDVTLNRTAIGLDGVGESVVDTASGSFQKFTLDYFSGSTTYGDLPFNSCTIFNFDDAFDIDQPMELPSNVIDLAAGRLSVNGPKGTKSLGNVKGSFSVELGKGINIALPPGIPPLPSNLYLESGAYTITGEGGDDVGPFSVQVQLNPVTWTNSNSIGPVNRGSDLKATWTGGGANDYVMLTGTSSSDSPRWLGSFVCVARASAREINVPSYILQNLPPTQDGAGFLSLFSFSEPKTFTARGLDFGAVTTSRMVGKQVQYQ
jgi:uncharacterized protein (TIGR03437 family)